MQRVRDVLAGVRKHASPSVRAKLEKYGDLEIYTMKICRKPIMSAIEKFANLISGGRWEKNKEQLSYDKLFHLFIVVELFPDEMSQKGKVLTIEKNHVVEIKNANWENDAESVPFTVSTDMTLKGLFESAEKRVGADKLFHYDARTQNCQFFVKWLLEYRNGWNASVEKFVLQDATKVMEGMGILEKVGKVATDVAHVGDVILNGKGHRRVW